MKLKLLFTLLVLWGTTLMAQNPIDLPITFDDANTNYTTTDFGGNVSSVVADPTNASNMVLQAEKTAGAQTWAGTSLGDVAVNNAGLASAIPFSAGNTSMTVKVWAPNAGTVIRLKVEDASNGAVSVETDATTTMAGAWETLTFDFTNNVSGTPALDLNATYNKASIFFDFGNAGTGTMFYCDDVMMVAPQLSPIDLPITFDDANTNYTTTDFGGNVSSVVADPTNASNMVLQAEKTAGAQTWAGTSLGDVAVNNAGLASAIPFSAGNTSMTVKVWAPNAGTVIRLKVEDASNGAVSVETDATTTMAGAWETLTFDFTNNVSGTPALDLNATYNKASIFFDFGNAGAGTMFYCDDVMMVAPQLSPIDLPITFDDANTNYTTTDFGGNVSSVVADPTNASNMVLQAEKTAGAQTWAGTSLGDVAVNNAGLASAIPFSAGNTSMTVKVWAPNAGTVIRLKVEDASNGAVSVETDATTTMAGAWETLTFDFTNNVSGTPALDLNAAYNKASIFFDFGNAGAGTMFYCDDVMMVAPQLSPIDLPITFDDANTNYTTTDFGGNVSSIVADPTNASNMVMQAEKTAGAQTWAGTTLGDVAVNNAGLASAIPFSAGNTSMTVKVWAPNAGTVVKLKVEDASNAAVSVETDVTTTMAGAWETLTFDFTNNSAGTPALDLNATYNKVSIFFDFGNTGAGTMFYCDDVMFASPQLSPIDLPITFDDANTNYTTTDFGGNASAIVADPTNASNMVLQAEKTAGAQTWAGTTLGDVAVNNAGLANAIPFAAGVTSMTVKVWAPNAGTVVKLKVEDASNAAVSVETDVTTTMAGAWETLTFDFTNNSAGTPAIDLSATYNKVSIFFDFGNAGTGTMFYCDDVMMVTGAPLNQIDLPITFDDATVDYTSTDFGGNASAVVVDPTNASNMVMSAEKTAGAQTWAGTTMDNGTGLANAIPFASNQTVMTVRVWAPNAGTPVLLKVEDKTDGTVSCEVLATTTVAGDWETLEFDFTNHAAGTPALDLNATYDRVSVFFDFGNPGAGTMFYCDDIDLKEASSNTSVQGIENKALVSLYPNPAQNEFTVNANGETIEQVVIMNLAGQVVYTNASNQIGTVTTVNVSNLNKGTYIVKTATKLSTYTQQLIVQ